MTFVSYAQTFEDVRLWRAFRDVGAGRYIDIGAQDPVRDSISLAFYERGWRGIHVEPTAAYADALRTARPDETVIEAVVTTAPGPIKFFEIPATGLSTGLAEIAYRHSDAGWDYREILVPSVTLAGLFDSFGTELVHWLKIDVEGMEADVIASWGDHPARPAVLIIEATAPNSQIQTHKSWHDMVLARGYSDVAFDGLSRFFVHKDHEHLRDAIAESPNVFDGFQVSDQHFSAEKLIITRQEEAVAAATAEWQARADATDAAAAAEIGRVHADYAVLEDRFVNSQEALGETTQRLADTESALGNATQRLTETENALDETTQRLADTENALDEATQRLADTESALGETTQRLTETENALGETAQRLAETENALGETTQRLFVAEGTISETAAQLSAVEEVLGDTSRALAETETALNLSAAREAAAEHRLVEVTAKLDTLQIEHGQLLREAGFLQGQLEATTTAHTERLADATVRLERAEQESRAATAELSSAKDEIARLLDVQLNLERRLQRAAALLASTPDPFARLPSLQGGLLRWLMPRSALVDKQRHAAEVSQFQSEMLLTAYLGEEGSATSMPASQSAIPDIDSNNGVFSMIEGDEPITTVPRLLEPHDRHFIHTAYQSLLGRAPDPEGERYYLGRLRAGTHKLDILGQLRRSPEGRAFIPGVAGLDRAIKRHRRANLPLIGWIIRWLTGAEGNSAIHRQLRILANDVGRQSCYHLDLLARQAALMVAVHEVAKNASSHAIAACPAFATDTPPETGTMEDIGATGEHTAARTPPIEAPQAKLGPHASHLLHLLTTNMLTTQTHGGT